MNFQHDLAQIAVQELNDAGISVPNEWDDYHICMKYLEIHQRWFDSSIPYEVKYSKELSDKLESLTPAEQAAIQDIENRLKNCQVLTPYMSKDIRATSVKKSDFLLKNWNIYHLHLEKSEREKNYINPNLLFFQPKGQAVHLIDVKPHPKGRGWFDRDLLNIIFDNWPELLIYMPDIKPMLPVSDDKMHELLKDAVSIIPFRDGALFPTNLGIAASGDSALAVRTADRIFNNLTIYQAELVEREVEIKNLLSDNGISVPESLDYRLEVENGYFIAYEVHTHAKIRMFPVQ